MNSHFVYRDLGGDTWDNGILYILFGIKWHLPMDL
jgi:hypothetical protein